MFALFVSVKKYVILCVAKKPDRQYLFAENHQTYVLTYLIGAWDMWQ